MWQLEEETYNLRGVPEVVVSSRLLEARKDWVVRFTPDSPKVELKALAAAMVLFIDITIALDRTD